MEGFATVATAIAKAPTSHDELGLLDTVMAGSDRTMPIAMTTGTHSTFTEAKSLPAQTTAASASSTLPLPEPAEVRLPEWPSMLIIFLLSWMAMGLAVAAILYLATFPERVAWIDRLLIRRRGESEGRSGSNSSTARGNHARIQAGQSESQKQHTTALTTGLGISITNQAEKPRLRKNRSFDQDSLGMPKRKPCTDVASTAPLPSRRSFTGLSPTNSMSDEAFEASEKATEPESGRNEVDNYDVWDREECLHTEDSGISSVLRSVGAVFEFVAAGLARLTSDRVTNGAEEGLLLPVKDEEREPLTATSNGY